MPYIKKENRDKFDIPAKEIAEKADVAGDLNYAITVLIQSYIKKKGLNYANLNEVIGMLECCKIEFYRKIVSEYEDLKAISNGDVNLLEEEINKAK